MPLDPQAQLVIDMLQEAGPVFETAFTPDEFRARLDELRPEDEEVEPVARVEDRRIAGPHGNEIPIRLYWPEDLGDAAPVVVFLHGGGWVVGSVDSYDHVVRSLTNRTGAIYASVEYRLAPEARFPAAPEDCYEATKWVVENAASLGGDPTRVAVAGDSAGGNLATVVCAMARDRGGPDLAFQALVYPVTDLRPELYESMRDNADGYFLTTAMMQWFYGHYLDHSERHHPHAAPIRAEDLSALPPALIVTAEYDPLRDEGEAYGKALADAGVHVTVTRYDGMYHGFFGMHMFLDRAKDAQAEVAAALRRGFTM